jgi:peptidyl-prolyl cis-trans isomerase SurA
MATLFLSTLPVQAQGIKAAPPPTGASTQAGTPPTGPGINRGPAPQRQTAPNTGPNFGGRISGNLTGLNTIDNDSAIDSIVAVVSSTPITRGELNRRLATVERQLQRQEVAIAPRKVFERQVLERLILEKAQLELARENGIRIEPGTLDRTIARIAQQNSMNLTEFRRRLESEGLNFNQFREDIEEELLLSRVRESQVEARIQISESEIDNFITDQKSAVADSEQINIAQILLRLPENTSEAERERLRVRAEQLLQDIRGGGDFIKASAQYSAAPDALTGGVLGLKPSDKLPSLFVAAVQKLKPGEVTLVRSSNGFHILKLLERKLDRNAPTTPRVEQIRARHILMRPSASMTAVVARQRLLDIRQNLLDGKENFEDMAKKFSVDGSASKGGELGWLYPGDTVPEFENVMKELQAGEISGVVESQFGLHLIQVQERKTDEISPERQRTLVKQTLRERKSEEAFQEWLKQLRDRTYVETRLDSR